MEKNNNNNNNNNNSMKDVKNPRQGANALSVLTFKWLLGTYVTGFKRELEVKDLYLPLDEHSSHLLGNKISRLWKEEQEKCKNAKNKSKPSLLRVLVRCFGCDILIFGFFLGFLEFVVRTTQPIILANLLKCFKGNSTLNSTDQNESVKDRTEAFYWGTGIVASILLDCLIGHPAFQGLTHMGLKIRVATCSLIYKKIMRLSKAGEEETSIGQMVNLLSNDVNRLDKSVYCIHYIWIAPIQTAVISYFLYKEVNLAAVGGILTLLLFIPFHGLSGKLTFYLTSKFAYKTDERLKVINEIIRGIKVIKMYAWEKPFIYLIEKARKKEVKILRKILMAAEINGSFETYVPQVCLFITIFAYVFFGDDINADKVYLVTAYYNVLRTTLYREFPWSIQEISEALVSIYRVQKFLMMKEVGCKSVVNKHSIQSDIALSLTNVVTIWNKNSTDEALRRVHFNVKLKSLTAVVGKVASGKTTLLKTILGETFIKQGEIQINGDISYASQESWLFASSIKQNILFGKPMDITRYEKVVEVCQLNRDFQLLPYGDNTLVGEKGINLSGGQCHRITLARSLYHEADIYLLDDPLAAVDAHVSKRIFEECIRTFLKGKTVILVTHQYQFLKYTDKIVIMAGGAMKAEGTYSELLNSEHDLTEMMNLENQFSGTSEYKAETPTKESHVNNILPMVNPEDEQLESRTLGHVSMRTYLHYFAAVRSSFLVFVVVLTSLACQATSSGSDYFISYWVDEEDHGKNFTRDREDVLRGRSWYIYIYGIINSATIFITLAQAYTFFTMCMKSSKNLHTMMISSMIRTSMSFFNANPVGRIMNRLSKDMEIIDTRVPTTILEVMQMTIHTVAVISIITSVNLYFLAAALVVGIVVYFLRIIYMRTSRSIKRLEGITRSPVFNLLSTSVHGLTTIRALKAQDILSKEFDKHQDLHSSACFLYFSGSRAFGMYVELLCSLFTGVVVYVLLAINDLTTAGQAGLVITQCILLTGMLQRGVKQTTELENHMVSVERILEYSNLSAEPNLERTSENETADSWPENGQVKFQNVTLTYDRQEKPALKNLDFTIEPKEMIGIVGRTGAGKSSLINALIRLADLDGEIYIDNIATSKIALQHLRSKISIIPQKPVLLAGTVRRNLDPFEEYTDRDLWCALEDVELKAFLDADLGLNMKVMEGGSNFSVGQRQLLCLARAIVRNNKILVLDEATANIDPSTDELIQKAVRRKFAKCTVLIIAHRLNTVMDSSKILVMDAGQVVEFDHPYTLLQKESGLFYSMVQQTGPFMAANFLTTAKMSYEVAKFHDNRQQ